MTRHLTIALSALALLACDSSGGGGSTDATDTGGASDTSTTDTTPAPGTVPAPYPQLEAGEASVVVASIDGLELRFSGDSKLTRGYLVTYGLILDAFSGGDAFNLLGLPSIAPGTYDQRSLALNVRVGSFDGLAALCGDGDAPVVVTVDGASNGVVWGTIAGDVCGGSTGGKRSVTGTRFTASVGDEVEAESGSCAGLFTCNASATASFSCEPDAPGCVWTPAACVGQQGACAQYDFSKAYCEGAPGCVYFAASCGGTVVVSCDEAVARLSCEFRNGCVWIPE